MYSTLWKAVATISSIPSSVKVQGLEEELEESEKTVRNLQTQLAGYVKNEAAQKQSVIQELAGRMATNAIAKGTYDYSVLWCECWLITLCSACSRILWIIICRSIRSATIISQSSWGESAQSTRCAWKSLVATHVHCIYTMWFPAEQLASETSLKSVLREQLEGLQGMITGFTNCLNSQTGFFVVQLDDRNSQKAVDSTSGK